MTTFKTTAVTECDLISPPALLQKLAFCTQADTGTDTRTEGNMDRQADSSSSPKTLIFQGYKYCEKRENYS